jgi:hypothetical protein
VRSAVAELLKAARVDSGEADGCAGGRTGGYWSCQVTLGNNDGGIEVSSGSCSIDTLCCAEGGS